MLYSLVSAHPWPMRADSYYFTCWRLRSARPAALSVECPFRTTEGRSWGKGPPSLFLSVLLIEGEVRAAILLPALFVRLIAEGLLLAVADGLDAVASDSELYQLVANAIGTA